MDTRRSVLIADDVASVRRLYTTVLRQEGLRVVEAPDGFVALQELENNDYDLLIMDLEMPRVGGLQVLQVLNDKNVNIPVMVISAQRSKKTVVEAAHCGIVDFLAKPINLQVFRERLQKILGTGDDKTSSTGKNSSKGKTQNKTAPTANNESPTMQKALLRYLGGSTTTIAPYRCADFVAELKDLSASGLEDLRKLDRAQIRRELEHWKDDARLIEKSGTFRKAFARGDVAVKILCVEFLPKSLPIKQRLVLFREWVFAKDHRVRLNVLERLSEIRNPKATRLILTCTEDNVTVVRDRAFALLLSRRLSDLITPIVRHYAERHLAMPPRLHRLIFGNQSNLVRQILLDSLDSFNIIHLQWLSEQIGRTRWSPGRDIAARLARHVDPAAREAAARSLACFRDRYAIGHLIRLVSDGAQSVRLIAMRGLRICPLRKTTHQFLEDCLSDESAPWRLYPHMLRDLESHSSALLRFCRAAFPGETRMIRPLLKALEQKGRPIAKLIKNLVKCESQERHDAMHALLEEVQR